MKQEEKFRLVASTTPPIKDEYLQELGEDVMHTASAGESDIPAGYTYLGQFAAHDLTRTSAKWPGEFVPSPAFDLDSLYGQGFLDPNAAIDRTTGRMILGKLADSNDMRDLPRDGAGLPRIPDTRNEENLLIAQIHRVFLELHNKLIGFGDPERCFDDARTLTILAYQDVLGCEFLSQIVRKDMIRDNELEQRNILINPDEIRDRGIPLEVSMAAFRFGHSMVRSSYVLNKKVTNVTLEALFAKTGRFGLGGNVQLPSEWLPDWKFLFPISKNKPQSAFRIKPTLVQSLKRNPLSRDSLAARNLRKGSKLGLASGQTVAEWAIGKLTAMGDARASHMQVQGTTLQDFEQAKYIGGQAKLDELRILIDGGMIGNTPLWYYLLAEDWLENQSSRDRGNHMGRLGSILIIETVKSLIETSAVSRRTHKNDSDRLRRKLGTGDKPVRMENILSFIN